MKKPLIIVESPTKARTIKKFLPPRYAVSASVGHVRDLPKSSLGVDVEHDFAPKYLTIKGKGDVIKELKNAVKGASEVYLATDPDREGEAIAWVLAELLKLPNPMRIELHEITKEAALAALHHPHPIDMDRVNAQQARRILDRLVGYKLWPLLWAKVRGGLSAGRVQSVAVKLIVDRERAIAAFVPREYWRLTRLASRALRTAVRRGSGRLSRREAEIASQGRNRRDPRRIGGRGVSACRGPQARSQAQCPGSVHHLDVAAGSLAQAQDSRPARHAGGPNLYEGIDLGGSEGTVGLITYMRTDSTRVIDKAREMARDYLVATYGEDFHGGRIHKLREGAQDAHEAIRPTSVFNTPQRVAGGSSATNCGSIRLIWERFVASQCRRPSSIKRRSTSRPATARSGRRGRRCASPASSRVYEEGGDARRDDEASQPASRVVLPELRDADPLDCRKIEPKQHFTEPPPRFTEAALVKALEENGVGRPSTYSTIVETIQARGYVTQQERRFVPTEIGAAVNDLLVEHFPKIVNLDFTASMEGNLDKVAVGNEDWVALLRGFYGPFADELESAQQKLPRLELRDEPTDEICPNCGRPMVIKTGRFGKFISCTGYPECKTTKPIVKDTGAKCPKDGGAILERRSRKGRTFYGCANYPQCDFVSWDRVVAEPCPVCGSYVTAKTRRGGEVQFRMRGRPQPRRVGASSETRIERRR